MSRLRSTRGTGLVMSLIVIVALSLLAATVHRVATTVMRESVYELRASQAQAIAEAGIEHAMARLMVDNPPAVNEPFAEGSYTVTATGDPQAPVLVSTGYSKPMPLLGSVVRSVTVRTRVQRGAGSRGWAIRARQRITLRDGSSVEPEPNPTGGGADLLSNGNLEVNGACTPPVYRVYGKGYRWSGALPPSQCFQDGVEVQRSSATILDAPNCPAQNQNYKLPPAFFNSGTRNLRVPSGSTASIYEGIYCVNNINLLGSATMEVRNTTAPVTFHMTGFLRMAAASRIDNLAQNPVALVVYGRNNEVHDLRSPAPIHMDLQAPPARINLLDNAQFHGRLIGRVVDLAQGATLFFDRRFTTGGPPTHVDWEPGSWALGFKKQ